MDPGSWGLQLGRLSAAGGAFSDCLCSQVGHGVYRCRLFFSWGVYSLLLDGKDFKTKMNTLLSLQKLPECLLAPLSVAGGLHVCRARRAGGILCAVGAGVRGPGTHKPIPSPAPRDRPGTSRPLLSLQTQPVPNPVAYYLHHSPWWFHRFETLSNHFIELLVPFFLFLGRRACIIHGVLQILFQVSPRRPPCPCVHRDAGPSPYFWLPRCLGGPWGITGPLSWGQPVLPSLRLCHGPHCSPVPGCRLRVSFPGFLQGLAPPKSVSCSCERPGHVLGSTVGRGQHAKALCGHPHIPGIHS